MDATPTAATSDKTGTKLALIYESIRRREYELITKLLDVLPKVEGVDEERVAQVRDALFHADHPYMIVFVGPFSSGKSSLINALLGKSDLLAVGPVPTTDRISILRYGEEPNTMRAGDVDTVFYPSPLLQKVSFVDTPGLESVFQKHEETTRRFLHRSDTVLLTMMATQAMTARNLEYLRMLREYGKNVIIVLNQVDLLSPEEAETVRQYVLDQSTSLLGFKPEVWMMSARKAAEARRPDDSVDESLWKESGLNQLEAYVDRQLSDVARLRQKLQTPLMITQKVHQTALDVVRANQATMDKYQTIGQNVDQQLDAQKREQDRIVRELNDEIAGKFGETSMRGGEAITDIFKLSRALGSVARGMLELVGLARLVRAGKDGSYVRTAFESRRAFEPINELPQIVEKLAPRLEGKDVQDIDSLVKYGKREIDGLPAQIRDKVIGEIVAPVGYDRSALQSIRADLAAIESEAKQVETAKLESAVRNTLLYLGAYEVLVLIIGIFALALVQPPPGQELLPFIMIIFILAFALIGLLILPLRGRQLENAYTKRMLTLQGKYIEVINKAANKQITYGMNLRRESIAPLTRLIEAQTRIQTEQLNQLQGVQQEMTAIEAELTAMGKGFLGLRG